MPLPELGGTLGRKRAAHLLRRATFGATVEQIDHFAGLTAAQAITQLFRQTLPDPPLPIEPATGLDWIDNPAHPDTSRDDLAWYFKGWFIGQMMSTGIPASPVYYPLAYSAREKLVFFLHTLFTAITTKIDSPKSLYYQNQLFRMYALDAVQPEEINIKELTKKISVDNAMLLLLDGSQNKKGSPNENYARELLELYSIGRGLEIPNYFGQTPVDDPANTDYVVYTENDVKAAARVLTGWTFNYDFVNIDPDTNLPRAVFNPSQHDNDPKQFSARLGGALITPDPTLMNGANPTEESALDEISQLIEVLYAQQETFKNICRKIYRFFVFAPHSEEQIQDVDGTVIETMREVFYDNGFKLQPVIENLLASQHFYQAVEANPDDDNFGAIIKSPLDLVVGTMKFFKVQLPDMTASPTEFYAHTREILNYLPTMGMDFYEPFDVAGYDAYHQFPAYHRAWISVNYLINRYRFLTRLFEPSDDRVIYVNPFEFIRSTNPLMTPDNARDFLQNVISYILPVPDNLSFDPDADDTATITAERMNFFLVSFLFIGDPSPEENWNTRWATRYDGNTTVRPPEIVAMFNALMQSPEYQLA